VEIKKSVAHLQIKYSTVPMLCAEITDKKQTSSIIRELNVQYPLPECNHLKRVKGGESEPISFISREGYTYMHHKMNTEISL
jgi:hypothetical protein